MSETNAREQLHQLLAGKWVAAAIAAAAEIGLADALAGGPRTLGSLAAGLACDPGALRRLLRVLGGEGLLELEPDGRYALTPLGHELREGRLRELARFVGLPFMWSPWSALHQGLRREESTFEIAMGAPLFEYLDEHPVEAEIYHRAVDAFTRREARLLAEAYDFGDAHSVVDVGGGLGTLLMELGARWPNLGRCVLFDRESVIDRARTGGAADALGKRLELVSGDFLEGVPAHADIYVLKHVLHNWEDAQAVRVLRHCRQGLHDHGRVLIVDGILLPGLRRDRTALLDLEMFVLCGRGRERSKPEFRALLRQAGLALDSTADLGGTTRLLVASKKA